MRDNPLAFPQAMSFGDNGMSLRDWFAGQAALAAIGIAEPKKRAAPMPLAAKLAYEFADAMLAARKENDDGK